MAPLHVKRKFWWELIFISALLYLLISAAAPRKDPVVAGVQSQLAPVAEALAVGIVPSPPLALK